MAILSEGVSLGTLEEWLNGRPSWLRAAAVGMIRDRRAPSEAEIDELATHCLAEAAKNLNTPHPPLLPGAILGTAAAADLRFDSISSIRGVNAIGESAKLKLSGADLTVIYGANGSGKSGYARLMKHLCGARAQGSMHGNVFDRNSEVASAVVTVSTSSAVDVGAAPTVSDIHWKAIDGPVQKLRAVPIFDSATAVELGDSASSATHLPRTMRFVGALIGISDRVSANLRRRSELLVGQLPAIPEDLAQTPAATFLRQLNPALTQLSIDTTCHFPEPMRLERLALEAALAQATPAIAHAKAVSELERITKLGESMTAWAECFSDARAAEIVGARADAAAKRQAATAYATSFFDGLPLAGVGEDVWRRMWTAATQYALERAYPKHSHPNTAAGARCVLCQQVLDSNAQARMQSFSDYVGNQLQGEAATAERTLATLVGTIPQPQDPDQWQALVGAVGLNEADAAQLNGQITKRLGALDMATTVDAVPPVSWDAWKTALSVRIAELTAQRDTLAALLDPTGRQQKEARLRELRGTEWLAAQRLQVIAEVDRLKQQATLAAAVRLTGTGPLTIRSNEIGEAELAQGFCDRFNNELRELGGKALPVVMTHRREGKGKFTFQIKIRDSKTVVQNREILSEGEQRIVALAAFLADAAGSGRSLPVIFDDPISSLDQRYEETVAKRLVQLAEKRQVLVFTHRLSLMVLIDNAAKKRAELALSPVQVQALSITRDGPSTGMPASIDVFSLKPEKGFNQLISTIGAVKKYDVGVRTMALKDACSNFRILVERSVEDHLCSSIVNRYRREIKTLNMLQKLTVIEPSDCAIINEMMTKYSTFEHSQSIEAPTWLPGADELLDDVNAMLKWIADFDKRAKAAAKSGIKPPAKLASEVS